MSLKSPFDEMWNALSLHSWAAAENDNNDDDQGGEDDDDASEDEERGSLGMHYTSVPNILKVLNPLFLDDLREKLEAAGENPRSLLNLRKRISIPSLRCRTMMCQTSRPGHDFPDMTTRAAWARLSP